MNNEFLAKFQATNDEVKSISKRVDTIDHKVNNSLISTARLWERSDESLNFNKRNCLVIRNLRFPQNVQIPTTLSEKLQTVL